MPAPRSHREATVEEAADRWAKLTPEGGQPDTNNAAEEGGLGSSWLLILVGGLLVALGVGAIVLLGCGARRTTTTTDDEDGANGPRGRSADRSAPAATGAATTPPGSRPGPVPGADPTMVNRPALADAPTMMHSRPLVDDEFPDPYGAPLPGPQGYAGGRRTTGPRRLRQRARLGCRLRQRPGLGCRLRQRTRLRGRLRQRPRLGCRLWHSRLRCRLSGRARRLRRAVRRADRSVHRWPAVPRNTLRRPIRTRPAPTAASSGAGHGGYEADPQYGQPDPQYGQPDPQYGQADGYGTPATAPTRLRGAEDRRRLRPG